TVVAFDLPINDLIPPGMTIDSFRIEPDPSQNLATTPDKESADHIGITFNGMQIDIATDISTTGMQLLWTVPMSTMLLESMQNILLPLLLNIGLLALALFGFTTFRHYKGRSHSSGAGLPSAANS
ncbi:phosphotransferase RcsD, partial [Pseudomonas aeruginosa]|nr:phosphotransferase RcsD [Pseudomonas aeruginosa]